METPFEWLRDFEDVLTDYNEGQKENNSSNSLYVAGRTGTGKGQLTGWLKEHGMASGHLKLFEAHATEPAHLEELFQFMFPNGFLLNYEAKEIVESIRTQLKKGAYTDPVLSLKDINKLQGLIEDGSPPERIDLVDEFLDREENRSLRQRLKEIRESQVEIRDRLQQTHNWVYTNSDLPDTFRSAYQGGLNRGFDVEVFVPISDAMPTCPVPDFFTPFAIPVDDFARHQQMNWGLQIVHGDTKFQEYRKTYMKAVQGIDGVTGLEDLKNVEGLDEDEFVEKGYYGDGQQFQVTEVEVEGQSLKAFQRDWASMFGTQGVVCSTNFEHRLRPMLKDAILSDKPDMVVLYTGFLNSDALRHFVITHFLETFEDIIQNLERNELRKIDRKFVVSGIEAQEWVKRANRKDEKTFVEDRVTVRQLSKMMDNCRHFGTDFWFDVKPDKAHQVILSKCSNRFVTSMNEGDVDRFSSWDTDFRSKYKKNVVNDRQYNNLDGRYPEFGFGFIYIESGSGVPEWKKNGRTNYGHRLPCPRMCVQDPVDKFSFNDFSFFTEELDRWDSIEFEEYQDALFKEDWEKSAEPFIEEARRQKKQEEKKEKEEEMERAEMRKQLACEKLRNKVNPQRGLPDTWKPVHEEIKTELVEEGHVSEDLRVRTIEGYTEELRNKLKEEAKRIAEEELDVNEIGEELKSQEEFLTGATSKKEKIHFAKNYIKENYEVGKDLAEEVAEDAAMQAWIWLKSQGYMDDSHKPVEENIDEYRETVGLNVPEDEVESSPAPKDSNLEDPGEEWNCECGALNGPDRPVCRSCTKTYEDVHGTETG